MTDLQRSVERLLAENKRSLEEIVDLACKRYDLEITTLTE